MIKLDKINDSVLSFILIAASVIVTMLAILNGLALRPGKNGSISVGEVTNQRYSATEDVINQVATEKLKQEAYNSVEKNYMMRDSEIEESVFNSIYDFFKKLDIYRIEYKQKKMSLQNEGIENITISQMKLATTLPILSDKLKTAAVNLSDDDYGTFKIDVIKVVESIFESEIKSDTSGIENDPIKEEKKKEIRDQIREDFDFDTIETQNLAYEIIISYIKPNRLYDSELTEKLRNKAVEDVEPVIIKENQMIIDKNDVVTEEVYQILDSLGFVQKSVTDIIWTVSGIVCMLIIIMSVALYYLASYADEDLIKPIEKTMLFTIYTMCILCIWLLKEQPFYILPIGIFTMLVAILMDSVFAILMNICFATLAYMIAKLSFDYYIYFIFSGISLAMLSRLVTQRSKIISIGFIIALIDVILFMGINLITNKHINEQILIDAAIIFCYAIVSVIIVIGSLPFWEATFGVITPIKLLDLTNPANPVLKRLTIEAPGTYHHSLIVANLAEAAAIDIGANHILARVGGYYHDIGKLKYPGYFYENQVSGNPHDDMDPYDSVEVIKTHVSYGEELVGFYKLPNIIKEMIVLHHGNTQIKYFYMKAKEKYEDVSEEDFRYNYPIPSFKEAAILMLADTVEAAVRSLIPSGKSMQEVEEFIRKLVNDKLNDGQLLNSNLTVRDIETIIKSFMRVSRGMYHERIVYPTDDKAEAVAEDE